MLSSSCDPSAPYTNLNATIFFASFFFPKIILETNKRIELCDVQFVCFFIIFKSFAAFSLDLYFPDLTFPKKKLLLYAWALISVS